MANLTGFNSYRGNSLVQAMYILASTVHIGGKTFFTETCEGMLSLNNDKIRPEVTCATPLGGKADSEDGE